MDAPITGEMLVNSYGFRGDKHPRKWLGKALDIYILATVSAAGNWSWFIWKGGEKVCKIHQWVGPQTKTQLNHFIQRLHWRKEEPAST